MKALTSCSTSMPKKLPAALRSGFNLVFNGGTVEQRVSTWRMRSPTSAEWCGQGSSAARVSREQLVDHEFLSVQPHIRLRYYAAAGFEALESAIVAFARRRSRMPRYGKSSSRTARAAWRREPGRSGRSDIFAPVLARRGDQIVDRPVPRASDVCAGACACSPPRDGFRVFELHDGFAWSGAPGTSSRCGNSSKTAVSRGASALPELQQWGDGPGPSVCVQTRSTPRTRPLGPAHAPHEVIRQHGNGRYSTLARPRLSSYTATVQIPIETDVPTVCRTAWPVTWCGHLLKCFAASFSK
jgi:hypothetical protein